MTDLYRPAPAAADHFDYLNPEIPEADSPEDIPDSLVRRFNRAEAMLHVGRHLIAQASEVLDSIDAELNR